MCDAAQTSMLPKGMLAVRPPQRHPQMKTPGSKPTILALACTLALGLAAGAAQAQSNAFPNDRQVWVAQPAQIWKNGYGECWHSGFGPPPGPNECNPAPVAQYVAPPPPPPPPAPYVAPPPPPYVAPAPAPVIAPPPMPPKKDRN